MSHIKIICAGIKYLHVKSQTYNFEKKKNTGEYRYGFKVGKSFLSKAQKAKARKKNHFYYIKGYNFHITNDARNKIKRQAAG